MTIRLIDKILDRSKDYAGIVFAWTIILMVYSGIFSFFILTAFLQAVNI